jgi:hypothetical protein
LDRDESDDRTGYKSSRSTGSGNKEDSDEDDANGPSGCQDTMKGTNNRDTNTVGVGATYKGNTPADTTVTARTPPPIDTATARTTIPAMLTGPPITSMTNVTMTMTTTAPTANKGDIGKGNSGPGGGNLGAVGDPATTFATTHTGPTMTSTTTTTTTTAPTANESDIGKGNTNSGLGEGNLGAVGDPTTTFTTTTTTTPTPNHIAAATSTPTLTTACPTATPTGGTAAAAGDVDMELTSHHDLQGASSIVGGVLRGQAQGNVYNMADYIPTEDPFTTKPAIGNFSVFGP